MICKHVTLCTGQAAPAAQPIPVQLVLAPRNRTLRGKEMIRPGLRAYDLAERK